MAASLLIAPQPDELVPERETFLCNKYLSGIQSGSKVTVAEPWFFSSQRMKLSAALGGDSGENRLVSEARRGRNRNVSTAEGEGAQAELESGTASEARSLQASFLSAWEDPSPAGKGKTRESRAALQPRPFAGQARCGVSRGREGSRAKEWGVCSHSSRPLCAGIARVPGVRPSPSALCIVAM